MPSVKYSVTQWNNWIILEVTLLKRQCFNDHFLLILNKKAKQFVHCWFEIINIKVFLLTSSIFKDLYDVVQQYQLLLYFKLVTLC